MARFILSKSVAAPPAAVFAVLTDSERIQAAVPAIKRIEKLTPGPFGVGTQLRETRVMFGREATETFEVTAFEPARLFTLSAVSCGTEFHCEHRFVPEAGGTRLELEVTTRAVSLFAKLMWPLGLLMAGPMKKAMLKDLDAIARAAEGPIPAAA
jgi:carbon monoxide dehydrogenase subunit G